MGNRKRLVSGRSRYRSDAVRPGRSRDVPGTPGARRGDAGIPVDISRLTLEFRYNDLASVEALFNDHPGEIAALVLEPETTTPPAPGFFAALTSLCRRHGALLILDETITGFRWHNGGARAYHRIESDLAIYGKGMANGVALSARVGKLLAAALAGQNVLPSWSHRPAFRGE